MAERHDEQLYGCKTLDEIFPIIDVVDNCESTIKTRALSAYQGKVLMDLIKDNQNKININSTSIEQLESNATNITIDDKLDSESVNPVQNKAIAIMINKLNNAVFPLSISVSGGSIVEKRTTQNVTVKWAIKEGNTVVIPDSLIVNQSSVDTNSTSKTFSNITGDTSFKVIAIKDGTSVDGTTSIKFVNPTYFGAVDADFEITEDNIKALTKSIVGSKNSTHTTSLTNQKTCYAYPKSFGALTAIKDANNFDYINSYTRSEITVWDETYYIYILADATTINNFKQIYS